MNHVDKALQRAEFQEKDIDHVVYQFIKIIYRYRAIGFAVFIILFINSYNLDTCWRINKNTKNSRPVM